MKKLSTTLIKIFLNELINLKEKNLLNTDSYTNIREYYEKQIDKNSYKSILHIVISIVAALFIAGGVILLIGYNWSRLNQVIKTTIAFAIVMIPQGICFIYIFWYKKKNLAFCEGMGIVWSLSFGAAMALIGQIYHIPANTEMYFFIWSVSSICILYILNSLSVSAIYLVLSLALASIMQENNKIGLVFIPMLALIIPQYMMVRKKESFLRKTIYHYFIILAAIVGLGITLEKNTPGLWIIAYANLMVLYYLISVSIQSYNEISLFAFPFKFTGIVGVAVLAFILSWEWAWEDIGWKHYRDALKYHDLASLYDLTLVIILPAVNIVLTALLMVKKKAVNIIFVSFGILIIILYVILSINNEMLLLSTWLMNFYILILCLYSFYIGFKTKSLLIINISMLYLIITIVSRFFDENMGLLVRGIVFIICGIILLIVNLKIVKKLNEIKVSP